MKLIQSAAALALLGAATTAPALADTAAGEKVFKRNCMVCHTVEEGKNKTGPSLYGIVGHASGSAEGFKMYSPAAKEAAAGGLVWTEENLKSYLADPKGFMPKNRMAFMGLKKAADVDALIEFLKVNGPAAADAAPAE